jgi:hypothetical protein
MKKLSPKIRRRLMDLAVHHRAAEGCADYEDSPTMKALLDFVERLLQAQAKVYEKAQAQIESEEAQGKRELKRAFKPEPLPLITRTLGKKHRGLKR